MTCRGTRTIGRRLAHWKHEGPVTIAELSREWRQGHPADCDLVLESKDDLEKAARSCSRGASGGFSQRDCDELDSLIAYLGRAMRRAERAERGRRLAPLSAVRR